MKLEHAEIFRGGASAPYLSSATEECSYQINFAKRALEFRFNLNAAGGGRTQILLRIGFEDLTFLLTGIDKLRIAELTQLQSKVKELALARNAEINPLFQRIAALEAKLEAKPNSGGSGIG